MTSPIRILGIDPGFDRCGVAVIDKSDSSDLFIYSTCLTTPKTIPFDERLVLLAAHFEEILQTWKPTHLSIETLFVTKNQKTAMLVAQVRGVIIFLAKKHGLSVHEYSPPQIKMSITGYGQAKKEDVSFMVEKILKTKSLKGLLDDEVDAIAIALTHSAHHKTLFWK